MASVEFHHEVNFPDSDLRAVQKDGVWCFKRGETYYPSVNEIVQRVPFNHPIEGELHEPLFPLENYDRSVENPEHVREYAGLVGRTAHLNLQESLEDDYRSTHKRDDIKAQLLDPNTGTEVEVVSTLKDYYPDRFIFDDLAKQAQSDARDITSRVKDALCNLIDAETYAAAKIQVIRCEHPETTNFLNKEREHGEAGYAGRIDLLLLHPDTEEVILVEIKTSKRVTNASKMQTVALHQLDSLDIDSAVIVRAGRNDYRIHEADEWDERRLYNRFKAEAITLFQEVN
ncbi:hypothetical protein SAMN06269185_1608 [Natronoarchaeum philippinense]|uniref:Uncharacterized protein n=1 Tax=Natronoarchaeum philippinense TaxID=558529 RepID=A0A285NWQ2_NATPI|nr:hypothetical protein [Natronoarchaeum philippinense]SNZ12316.1 hypothetical protein SAMN06269185_1608 [Natronoarchaeum philippinense]